MSDDQDDSFKAKVKDYHGDKTTITAEHTTNGLFGWLEGCVLVTAKESCGSFGVDRVTVMEFTPKKARKLAKALKKAARHAESTK